MKLVNLYLFTITVLCTTAIYGAASTSSQEDGNAPDYYETPLMVNKSEMFFTYNRPYRHCYGITYEPNGIPGDVPLEMQLYDNFLIILLKFDEGEERYYDEGTKRHYTDIVKYNKYGIIVFDLFFNQSYTLVFSVDDSKAPSAIYNFNGMPTINYYNPDIMLGNDTKMIEEKINEVKKYLNKNAKSIRRAHLNELIVDSELALADFKNDAKSLKDLSIAATAQHYLNEMKATGETNNPSKTLHSTFYPWQAATILSFLPDIPKKHHSLPLTSLFRFYYINNKLFQPINIDKNILPNFEKIALDPNGNYAIAVTKVNPEEYDKFSVKFKNLFCDIEEDAIQESDQPRYKFSIIYPRPLKNSTEAELETFKERRIKIKTNGTGSL